MDGAATVGASRGALAAMSGPPEKTARVDTLRVDVRAKRFGAAQVLGHVAFTLAAGETAALLGPSGVGKSTLLAMIAGTDADFDGAIARPPGRLAMVFQTPRLLPWRTLAENIALIPGAGGIDAARALLARVGLGAAADQHPERVSLGMQRRAALARALAVRPSLLLMDEPLVSLDVESAQAMRALIAQTLAETGAAALIATHDRREALALTGRLLELGGAPATLLSDRASPLDAAARADPALVEALHAAWF